MVSKTSNDLRLLASENDSENGSTTKPNNSLVENRGVTTKASGKQESSSHPEAVTSKGTKRKSHTGRESPQKKRRCHSNNAKPTEVPVEDVTAKGTKRKATPETETPSKKQRGGNNHTDTNTTKVSVDNVRETGSKKEACTEHLQTSHTPRTTRKDGGSERILSSGGPSTSEQPSRDTSFSDRTSRASFEAKYLQLFKLGEGGFGAVYAGQRISDQLPVAIKHIERADVKREAVVSDGRIEMIPKEVFLMQKVAGGPESVGKSATVSLLDWYDLENEVLLVMERPVPSVDLFTYLEDNNGPVHEDTAKNIMKQLVEAAIEMHVEGVFHRDLKPENILIQSTSSGPRVRIIDFGCGCTVRNGPYHSFAGTISYAPPEYFECRTYEACPTTVWQLGALLFELLDGYTQFNTVKFMRKKININNALSKDCKNLLDICLDENPVKRVSLEQIPLHPWFQ